MNLMASIIYVVIFTLLSLLIFTLAIKAPVWCATKNWIGINPRGTPIAINPSYYSLKNRIITIAIIAKGDTISPNKKGALIYIKLKSLDNILIVLPIYPLFDVNCVK